MKQNALWISILIVMLLVPGTAVGSEGDPETGALVRHAMRAVATETWVASYWNNVDLGGDPVLVRSEQVINHDWGTGSPAKQVNSDNFSAHWTRTVWLDDGIYRFTATSDDGMRVWLDGKRLIRRWQDYKVKTTTVERHIDAGVHEFTVEYFETTGRAEVRLSWAPVVQIQNWRGEYYANRNLSGEPAVVRDDAEVRFDWGNNAPAAGIPADGFSARWTRELPLAAGLYRFTVTADDGMRLWVDDQLVIDAWREQAATRSADVRVPRGGVPVRLEYYEGVGTAQVRLQWTKVETIQNWRGEYYANKGLRGSPALVRDDAEIKFDWGTGAPASGLPADGFSARWTRTLPFKAGTYRFTVTADDGVRLWVRDRLVIDAWRDQPATAFSADVVLPAGDIPLRLEYYDNAGEALVRLGWAPTGTVQNWRGEYYGNKNLVGSPALVRDDADINFTWGTGAPASGLPADGFSARWTRTLPLQAGTYRFTVTADDGVRLWVRDRLVIDAWRDQPATSLSADVNVPAGDSSVRLEYYDNAGEALVRLSWALKGTVQNWRGEYYANKDLIGTPALVRDDADINFNWGSGAPASGLPANQFSVRWTRQLSLGAGTYRFAVTTDDGVRLWVRDRLVIDQWRDQGTTTYTADVALPGDAVPVRLEYYDNQSDAVIKLSWAPVSGPQAWRGEYYGNRDLYGTPAVVRDDAQIAFRWGPGAPAAGLPSDNFSVRWTQQLPLDAGNYRFTVTADDGARLWVNNQLIIDAWRIQGPTTYSGDIYLPGGRLPVRLEYFEATSGASIYLSWARW